MGEPDVDGLLARLTSGQVAEWMAFDWIEPLPDPWVMNGLLCAVVANSFRGPRGKRAKPEDFIPRRRVRRRQTARQMMLAMAGVAARSAHLSPEGKR